MAGLRMQEKVMVQQLAKEGLSDRAIAERMHISPYTARKWRRRANDEEDLSNLSSLMGRPARGSLSTFPPLMIATLEQWRDKHPGWGPKTLLAELSLPEHFCGERLPDESTIARWLKHTGRAKTYHKHSELPSQPVSIATACHEEWEMDARGHELIEGVGVIALIEINDVYSKVKLNSYPCLLGQQRASHHPTTQDYQTALRLAFTEWGLPDRLAVDHDSVYYDNLSKSPFPTRFHLWLLALGITLTFGRMGIPQDQAMTERSHQTWYHQVLEGQSFCSYDELFWALQQRLEFLNLYLPCATLGELAPLVAHPEARTPRRRYHPEIELDLMDQSRIYAFLSQGKWFRKASNIGAVCLGKYVYCLGPAWIRAEVVISFDPKDGRLVFQSGDRLEVRKAPQGLSCQDLLGNALFPSSVPYFQLTLPFTD